MLFDFLKKSNKISVNSPVSGTVKNLSAVKDEAFSKGLLGNGLAVIPSSGEIYCPVDGTLVSVFPTGHAFGIRQENGVELILHIGVDTVRLKGKGFNSKVKQDQSIKKGDLLTICDFQLIRDSGYETDVILVVSNCSEDKMNFLVSENDKVDKTTDILEISE